MHEPGEQKDRSRGKRRSIVGLVALVSALTGLSAEHALSAAKKTTRTTRTTKSTEAPLTWELPNSGVTVVATTRLTPAGSRIRKGKGRANSISLTGPRGLERDLIVEARALAQRFGNSNTVVDQATLELVGVERAGRIVQISRYPFSFPISTISLGPIAASELYGPTTAGSIRINEAVLGKTSARLRKAKVGDVLVIRHWDRPEALIRVRIGAVVPDEDAGSAELVVSRNTASTIGFSRPSRIVAWGKIDKVADAWADLVPISYLRRSATPPNIDSVLSQAELKLAYGEFTVRRDRGQIESESGWTKANVVPHNYPILGRIACHREMQVPLERALTEILRAGLTDLIDVRDTKRGGGCYSAREIRTAKGTSGRNLSRHSWGAAVDINPSTNRFGEKPTMDARIIYVFRRNGFAWGGTWSIPDGMHFELIGPPRIVGPTLPSSTTTTSTTTTSTTTTSTTSTTTTTVFSTASTASTTIAGGAAAPSVSTSLGASTSTSSSTSTTKPGRSTTTRPGRSTTPIASTTAVPSSLVVTTSTGTIPTTSSSATTTVPLPTVPPLQEPSAGDVPA